MPVGLQMVEAGITSACGVAVGQSVPPPWSPRFSIAVCAGYMPRASDVVTLQLLRAATSDTVPQRTFGDVNFGGGSDR